MARILGRLLIGLVILFLLAVLSMGGLVLTTGRPMPSAEAAMLSDAQVVVSAGPWLEFRPIGDAPSVGLIIYPGALVNAEAYAPVARAIARPGYLVIIMPMLLNLAILTPDRASEALITYPEIKQWAIAGHSLGGAMAARYVATHPGAVAALALWASYPADTHPLTEQRIDVVSIYGTQDGLTSPAQVEASRALLPPSTRFVAIEGGNHGQFGSYGDQRGDAPASISREAQHAQIVTAMVELLAELND